MERLGLHLPRQEHKLFTADLRSGRSVLCRWQRDKYTGFCDGKLIGSISMVTKRWMYLYGDCASSLTFSSLFFFFTQLKVPSENQSQRSLAIGCIFILKPTVGSAYWQTWTKGLHREGHQGLLSTSKTLRLPFFPLASS